MSETIGSEAGRRAGAAFLTQVQILRFAAAFLVLLGHTEYQVVKSTMASADPVRPLMLLDWGLGVDIFFVISGFIMYYLMHASFGRSGVTTRFFVRRLRRIVPLYWIFTALMLVAIVLLGDRISNGGVDPAHILASFAFVPWPRLDGEIFPVLSLGWTLNYEMLFYVLFALALGFSRRTGLILLCGVFLVLVVIGQVAPSSWWMLRFWGNPIIGEFLAGIALAAVFLTGRRIGGATSLALIVVGLLLAVLFFRTGAYETITRLVTGGVPALLIAIGVIFHRAPWPQGPIVRSASLCGDASYALYLCHPFTINIAAVVWGRVGGGSPTLLFLGAVVLSLIGGLAVHLLIERPLLRAMS